MSDLDELAKAVRQRNAENVGTLPYRGAAPPPVAFDYPPCPVCGYRGPPAKVPKGSMLVAVSLLFIGVLPGLIYLMFFGGDIWTCWQCGATKADA